MAAIDYTGIALTWHDYSEAIPNEHDVAENISWSIFYPKNVMFWCMNHGINEYAHAPNGMQKRL